MNYTLKRNDNQASITLPGDMRWLDEFDWADVAQSTPVRTLSGGLIIQQGLKTNGRPITFAGQWAWQQRQVLKTLRDWSDVPQLQMTLTHIDGRTFNVCFRTHESALGNVEPVLFQTPETDSDYYTFTIHLMTI